MTPNIAIVATTTAGTLKTGSRGCGAGGLVTVPLRYGGVAAAASKEPRRPEEKKGELSPSPSSPMEPCAFRGHVPTPLPDRQVFVAGDVSVTSCVDRPGH